MLTPLYPRCFDPSGGCGASIFTSCGRAKNFADYPYIEVGVNAQVQSRDYVNVWRYRAEGSAFVESRRNGRLQDIEKETYPVEHPIDLLLRNTSVDQICEPDIATGSEELFGDSAGLLTERLIQEQRKVRSSTETMGQGR